MELSAPLLTLPLETDLAQTPPASSHSDSVMVAQHGLTSGGTETAEAELAHGQTASSAVSTPPFLE